MLIASGAAAAAAEVLVVRASGPSANSYPAGTTLADDARISLRANDTLVLLDDRGTRTLRGPGTFSPSSPVQANNRSAIMSVASGTNRRARIGAVRGVGDSEPLPASIWYVDIARSSNICLVDPTHVTLWRADATKPVTLTIARPGGGGSETVEWPSGEPTVSWPSNLAIGNGAEYRLSWDGASAPTNLTFTMLASEPTEPEAMAATLIQNHCDAQLDVLIQALQQPPTPEPATEG